MKERARAGDVAPHFFQLFSVRELLGRPLHPKAELLLQERRELRLELFRRLAGERFRLVRLLHLDLRQPPMSRWTNVVRIGSFAEASANASRATDSSTPSIS